MSKEQKQKQPDIKVDDGEPVTVSRVYVPPDATIKADLDRVLQILRDLPTLRRYGDDGEAIEEAKKILEGVKEKL